MARFNTSDISKELPSDYTPEQNEMSIGVISYDFFGSKFYFVLDNRYKIPFNKFIEELTNNEATKNMWEHCRSVLISECLESISDDRSHINNHANWIIKNRLGISDFDKLEEYYSKMCIVGERNTKIDDIIK